MCECRAGLVDADSMCEYANCALAWTWQAWAEVARLVRAGVESVDT